MSTDRSDEHTPVHNGADGADASRQDPSEFWESHYGDAQVWSGNVNPVLEDVASTLMPGEALDLGCGEGGDVLWLARQGWRVVGVDISATATMRARAAAEAAELSEEWAAFVTADLTALDDATRPKELKGPFALVTASFLQSPVALDRKRIFTAAAELVAPGGHLLVTSHAAPPSWAAEQHGKHEGPGDQGGAHSHEEHSHDGSAQSGPVFVSPEEELAVLDLEDTEWETVLAEVRTREVTAPDGSAGSLDDSVVLVRRRGITAAPVR